jgi:SAM-dependent methyltransferase
MSPDNKISSGIVAAQRHCRVCGNDFFAEPLRRYANMPKAAQFLPDAAALRSDHGVDLEVCQCSGCGLVQLSNGPLPYYREVIRAAAFSPEMKIFRLQQFAAFVRDYSLYGKKVVEIGCGRGEYLSLMEQVGVDAYGLEDSAGAVAYCREAGLKVTQGFVQRADDSLIHAPFAAFYLLNFLEHLPDPNETLQGIRHNLTDDAVGLIEVPNFDMILRKNLFTEFISDHLLYFSKETLHSTLALNGFEVIACTEIWYDYIVSAIVRKRGPLDLAHFQEHQGRLQAEIEEYISHYGERRVAIWGAGHQAFTVIALVNLSDKIRYVVDSAPFKQGKYTPATHIPIVSPEHLCSDPVDAVIVMAASYSDEVAGIIKERYQGNIDIAILRDYGLQKISSGYPEINPI